MAISNEILRLQNAKAALKTAINAKNDSSHRIANETIEDYAGFVDTIHDALPAAYTELEYIESTGTQYIDTDYYPNSDDLFEMKIRFNADTAQQRVFCSRINDGKKKIFEVYVNGSKQFACNITTESETNRAFSPAVAVATGVDYVLNRTGNFTYSLNGTSYSVSSYTYLEGEDYTEPLHLFGGSYIVSLGGKNFNGRFYYFKVPNKIHLVPSKRNSDNAIGMYDKVSGTFYTNSGTGAFTPGLPIIGTFTTKTITTNGTYNATTDNADGYSQVTVNVQTSPVAESKDVNFYDYDGTILYSYTAAEFQQLTELPPNPGHAGLTSQGWNWTLADAKAQVTAVGACDIGQMYVTDDGKTRLYCHFEDAVKHFYFGLGVNGTLLIDWGDGTTSTMTGSNRSSVTRTEHTYATGGDYVITITVSSGNFAFYGTSNYGYLFSKSDVNASNIHYPNLACLKRVELGSDVYFDNYSFCRCSNLETITIPSDMPSSVGTWVFYYCCNLKHVTIPTKSSSPITSLTNYMFYYAYSLQSISLPKTITSIGSSVFNSSCALKRFVMPSTITSVGTSISYSNYCITKVYISTSLTEIKTTDFYRCYSLSKLVVPASVTSIATKAFQDCYGMREYHFKSTTPPTLDNADAFTNIQSDCVIYVPSESLTAYQGATNWSTYASQMVGE